MKKKKGVIVNSTGGSPYHGPNFRSYYIGKNLLKFGYDVTIIANSYFHKFYNTPLLKGTLTYEVIDGLNYIWIKTKKYQTRGFFQVLNQNNKPKIIWMIWYQVYRLYSFNFNSLIKFV